MGRSADSSPRRRNCLSPAVSGRRVKFPLYRGCDSRYVGRASLPHALAKEESPGISRFPERSLGEAVRLEDLGMLQTSCAWLSQQRTDTYDEFDELRTRAPLRVSDSGQRGTRHREAILQCVLMVLKVLATGGARRTAASVQKTTRSVRRPSSGSRRFPPDQSGRQRGLRHAPVLGAPPSTPSRSVAAFTSIRPDESVLQRGGKLCPKYPQRSVRNATPRQWHRDDCCPASEQ